jgi:hypothetical protein
MHGAAELFSDSEPVSAEVASWCKSVIGCLHFSSVPVDGMFRESHSLTATLLWGQLRHWKS